MNALQPLAVVLGTAMGRVNPVHRKICDDFIKQHSIPIAGTVQMGRGTSYLVSKETADEITAICARLNAPPVDASNENKNETEIHIGALEAKCDRIETGVKRLHDEVAVLVKANNVLADKLSKVLSSLGAN